MDASWKAKLADEFKKPYFAQLASFVRDERAKSTVFPGPGDIFNAFKYTPFDDVKVVILGQDPYHNAGQAHGLSFSVMPGVRPPPSLVNIFKEAEADIGFKPPGHGYLKAWADRGVFLLNTVLTVRAHEPGSHRGKGWETLTDRVIELLAARARPMVFVLWGKPARDKARLIDENTHLIIEAPHPSPMSAHSGFFGSRPFSQVNDGLRALGQPEMNWQL